MRVWHVLAIAVAIAYFAPTRKWRLTGIFLLVMLITFVGPGGV